MKCKAGREASSPQDAFPALPHLQSCTLLPCTLTLHFPAALVVFLSLQLKCRPHPHPSQAGSLPFPNSPDCANESFPPFEELCSFLLGS